MIVSRSFDQFSPRNCIECTALEPLQFFHLIDETFLMSFKEAVDVVKVFRLLDEDDKFLLVETRKLRSTLSQAAQDLNDGVPRHESGKPKLTNTNVHPNAKRCSGRNTRTPVHQETTRKLNSETSRAEEVYLKNACMNDVHMTSPHDNCGQNTLTRDFFSTLSSLCTHHIVAQGVARRVCIKHVHPDTSSVIIGLDLVFLNLCSIISESLLFLSFQKNHDLIIF